MKTLGVNHEDLSVAGLAAGCCLVTYFPAASLAQNSNTVSAVTCEVALEGSEFTEIAETTPADPCCYVLEEADWYNTHDVLLHRWYQRRDDAHVYLTSECRSDASQGSAISGSSAAGGDSASSSAMTSSSAEGGQSSSSSEGGGHSSSSAEGGDHSSSSGQGGGHPSSSEGGGHSSSSSHEGSSSSSSGGMSSTSSEPPSSEAPGNPGNAKPVGGAGEAPNGDVSAFKPDPGTKGKSN